MFFGLAQFTHVGFAISCTVTIATTFVLRMLTLHFNWTSTPLVVDENQYEI